MIKDIKIQALTQDRFKEAVDLVLNAELDTREGKSMPTAMPPTIEIAARNRKRIVIALLQC